MQDDNDTFHQPSRGELLATLGISGLTLAVLCMAGYFAPSLLAIALH
ncbi:hypothetical protein [Pseudomonas guariconensis]